MDIGVLKGEKCNREGCKGVLDDLSDEGSCSCHINPPCSHCTTDTTYCPECGWEALEEQLKRDEEELKKYKPVFNGFKIRTLKDLDSTKVDYISKKHTNFSMIKEGVYPKSWDYSRAKKEIYEKCKGSFGGRFESIGNGNFKFIAYTD